MGIALVSLIILVLVIFIGFFRKINVGLVAILAVTIFGTFIGEKDSVIIKGFSSSLFIMLLGVSFLCSIGITNGSLELMSKKILKLSGGYAFIAPILIYIIGFGIAAIGPGCVPALGIVAALSLPLGKSTGYDPVMLAIIGEIGSFTGRFSPITPESLLIQKLTEPQGITNYQSIILIYASVTTIILSVIIFIIFKGYKVKTQKMEQNEIPSFNKNQIFTLIGFLIVIIACTFYKRNVGLISFAVGILLILIKAADEKAVFKAISWSTLLMITGFGMLMDIVILVGGVSLLSDSLAKIMTPHTAVAIQGLTGGIMSWFSSAIGVVWPTLVPTVGNIANSVGVPADSLISILCLTASFAGLSPASTGGGLIMAANATDPDFTKEKENKLFIKLFAISVLMVVLIVIAALFGLYSIL
ncbi:MULTISPECIES: SLC13 family permease [Fusobacterium]|jgi:Di-and tricarboxylate transporters|uniref:Carboxylate transporter n=1 Tax=Fusobacterium nucleatum subsp. polymorphum TaxID=76857 RepID=A0A1Z3CII7_FUSNP|nr:MULTISPECIES: SLC13 family permease [Fusobacterium]ASC03255.1 carboxylate transporter [Fusobacterium polymorphum]EUB31440.1 dicarboxylate carrier protein MatC N-terminal domain protein [Fusobacterium sp. OBRC1]WRL72689.1 SLC13 family permease [Fusobacterium polymorphum]